MKHTLITLLLGCAVSVGAYADPGEFSSPTIGIGVIVSDLDKAMAFYTNVVGMTRVSSFDVDEDFTKRSGLTEGTALHVEVLKLIDGPESTQWKLMTFGDKAARHRNPYISSNTGIQYVTITVKNLTPFVERIKKHKVKLLGETPIPLGGNSHFVLIKDPDGTFVELIGPMK